jgi:hypothetical protein
VLRPFTETLPKFRLLALSASFAEFVAADPLSFTLDEEPREVIAVSVPEAVPEVEPINAT